MFLDLEVLGAVDDQRDSKEEPPRWRPQPPVLG